ncbi:MAG: hypothetical protein WBV94_24960 [Blastocatellia bacterium]
MITAFLKDIPFQILKEILPEDYCKTVIERVLDYRTQASPNVRKPFEYIIRKTIKIKGQRDPFKALKRTLLNSIVDFNNQFNTTMGFVLPIWIESHADLEASMRDFLPSVEVFAGALTVSDSETTGELPTDQMRAVVSNFQQLYPDYQEENTIALMLCCLMIEKAMEISDSPYEAEIEPANEHIEGAITEPTAQRDDANDPEDEVQMIKAQDEMTACVPQEEASTPRWAKWLELLRAISADAAEWDTTGEFIEALRSLAREKLQERHAVHNRLQLALDALVEHCAEDIKEFGLADVSFWTVESCPSAEATVASEQAEQLRQAVDTHKEMRQKPTVGVAEYRQRSKDINELEMLITRLHERLVPLLAASSPPEELPPDRDGSRILIKEESHKQESDQEIAPGEAPALSAALMEITTSAPVVEGLVEIKAESATRDAETIYEEPVTNFEKGAASIQADSAAISDSVAGEVLTTNISTTIEQIPPTDHTSVYEPATLLRSSKEVATLLETDDSNENWLALLWAIIAEDDLPAAYWLARSLANEGRDCPMPTWLLAALQGARWLSSDSDALVGDLLEIASSYRPNNDDAQELMGLSAALRPALLAPSSGLNDWLKVPDCCAGLYKLVAAVKSFAEWGNALRPEDLLGAAGAEQREAAIVAASLNAKGWLEEESKAGRRKKFDLAADVWRHLLGSQGELRAILAPVTKDLRGEVGDVRRRIGLWVDREDIVENINKLHRELAQRKVRDITGDAREQFVRDIRRVCDYANRWCDLVEREREIKTGGIWLFKRVAQLREGVQEAMPEASARLSDLTSADHPIPIRAAALCLQRTIEQIWQMLNTTQTETDVDTPATGQDELWLNLEHERLAVILSRRLLWLPEVRLGDDGSPEQSALPQIAPALRTLCAKGRTLRDTFEGWLEHDDYRFAEQLLSVLQNETDAIELSRRYQEALDGSRAALRDVVFQTTDEIEQAVIDGIIKDERSEYIQRVLSINYGEALNFRPLYDELKTVRDELEAARERLLGELRAEWLRLEPQIKLRLTEPQKWDQVCAFVQNAFDHRDTRVIEECLARLTEIFDGRGSLDEDWFNTSTERDLLTEFITIRPQIESYLKGTRGLQSVISDIVQGREIGGIRFAELPPEQREESSTAIEAWRQLKQSLPKEERNAHYIAILARYLGFHLESVVGTAVQVKQTGLQRADMRATLSLGDLKKPMPLPQFGSHLRAEFKSYGNYDVICLWERPGIESIAARLRELRTNAKSLLVFYMGRLQSGQRREIARISRDQELALAVLDETLLIFLAGLSSEDGERLLALLRCALPFTTLNPYTPDQPGDVPPEMFVGREEMARELQRPSGSCVVYGGRQLGKSALLKHVQRQFHKGEQYAWIEDLSRICDPAARNNIWRQLRDSFKQRGLLQNKITTGKPEEIERYIREAIYQSDERRVLVMFDEADEFLDADARDDFREVKALRRLMLDTGRRFKIVFAGLESVQRFQGIPNQPLAHFGRALLVGPLEPKDAQALVRKPLEILGYRFDDATVLRILSYTNYHPGLIQIFCDELLKRMQTRAGTISPPYKIEQSDVESVYRMAQVRDSLRERFEWTLDLDARYQAITWAMIADQIGERDSYRQAYSADAILNLARAYWPQGFSEAIGDQLRILLDEMYGLGVLVRDRKRHYHLRSPNLARLMGTEDDILNRLDDLSRKPPKVKFEADSYHAPLNHLERRYSPLTYSQERALDKQQFGVGLIFASEALGFHQIKEAIKQFVPPDLPEESKADCTEITTEHITAEQLQQYLERHLQEREKYEQLVVYHALSGRGEDLAMQVETALKVCLDREKRERARRRWLRVIFIFDSQATWDWLSLPRSRRAQLEDLSDAVIFSRQWNLFAVRQRLSQNDKNHLEKFCQEVHRATGGWPWLLDKLFDRCGAKVDTGPFAHALEQEIADASSEVRRDFRNGLGVETIPLAWQMLELIRKEQEVPLDLIGPELLGGEQSISQENCETTVEYLQRMGCVEMQDEMLRVEKTVGRALA